MKPTSHKTFAVCELENLTILPLAKKFSDRENFFINSYSISNNYNRKLSHKYNKRYMSLIRLEYIGDGDQKPVSFLLKRTVLSSLDPMTPSMNLMTNQPMTNTLSSTNKIIILNILNPKPITNPFLDESTPMKWSTLISNKNDKNNKDNTIDITA